MSAATDIERLGREPGPGLNRNRERAEVTAHEVYNIDCPTCAAPTIIETGNPVGAYIFCDHCSQPLHITHAEGPVHAARDRLLARIGDHAETLTTIVVRRIKCSSGMTAAEAADFGLPLVAHYPADPKGAPGCGGCAAASAEDAATRGALALALEALGVDE